MKRIRIIKKLNAGLLIIALFFIVSSCISFGPVKEAPQSIPVQQEVRDPLAPKSGIEATVAWLDRKYGPPEKVLIFEDSVLSISLWIHEWTVEDKIYKVYKINGQYRYIITIQKE